MGKGALRLPTPIKLRMPGHICRSRTAGDEIRGREGNNPDHRLRSPSDRSVGNEVGLLEQPGGWLRSSHPFKSA